jgi:hypothetical protein
MRLPSLAYQAIKMDNYQLEKVRAQMNPLAAEYLATEVDAIFSDEQGNFHIAEIKANYYAPWGTPEKFEEQKDQLRRLVQIARAFKHQGKLWFISRTGYTKEGIDLLKSYGDTVVILGPQGDKPSPF